MRLYLIHQACPLHQINTTEWIAFDTTIPPSPEGEKVDPVF